MPTNREILLSHDYFYHVTDPVRLKSIFQQGLLAAPDDADMYRPYFDGKLPVFLCTQHVISEAVAMIRNKFQKEEIVVLRVPAEIVAELPCDVDHSFSQVTKGMDFQECLSKVGFIACLSPILPAHLERVEDWDETKSNARE